MLLTDETSRDAASSAADPSRVRRDLEMKAKRNQKDGVGTSLPLRVTSCVKSTAASLHVLFLPPRSCILQISKYYMLGLILELLICVVPNMHIDILCKSPRYLYVSLFI